MEIELRDKTTGQVLTSVDLESTESPVEQCENCTTQLRRALRRWLEGRCQATHGEKGQ